MRPVEPEISHFMFNMTPRFHSLFTIPAAGSGKALCSDFVRVFTQCIDAAVDQLESSQQNSMHFERDPVLNI